jgi:hypothetical protein
MAAYATVASTLKSQVNEDEVELVALVPAASQPLKKDESAVAKPEYVLLPVSTVSSYYLLSNLIIHLSVLSVISID